MGCHLEWSKVSPQGGSIGSGSIRHCHGLHQSVLLTDDVGLSGSAADGWLHGKHHCMMGGTCIGGVVIMVMLIESDLHGGVLPGKDNDSA